MRTYYRPRGSSTGVSFGTGESIAIGIFQTLWYVLLFSICLLFIWPFQFIWKWLPQKFPNRELAAVQVVLTLAWVGVLVWAGIAGSTSGGTGSGASPPAAPSPSQSGTNNGPQWCDHDGGIQQETPSPLGATGVYSITCNDGVTLTAPGP